MLGTTAKAIQEGELREQGQAWEKESGSANWFGSRRELLA